MRLPLELTDHHVPVPYPAIRRPNSENHGFIDIKNRPELAGDIPKARDFPPLLNLLRAINRSGSPFATLGCEKAFSDYSVPDHPELKTKLCGYVDICFARVDRNLDRGAFEEAAFSLASYAAGKPQPQFSKARMELCRATYAPLVSSDIKEAAYCMSIWVAGFGVTEAEALERYSSLMAIATEFFEQSAVPEATTPA